jgi:hypothetical protein
MYMVKAHESTYKVMVCTLNNPTYCGLRINVGHSIVIV